MPAVTATTLDRVNAFPINGMLLFKHYFEGEAVFARLKPYYNGSQYRFEIPTSEFDSVRRFLHERGYDIGVVDRPADYYVVVRQYAAHPDGIFKQSVHHQSLQGYNCFLMTGRDAVADAVAQGAIRLAETPLTLQSKSVGDYAMS